MSLVGSLEDLGLGDILQIITLSRKSGALLLRSDGGEGRVIFRDGLVCGARVKGRTPDLRQLLLGDGALDESAFESTVAEARSADAALAPALAERIGPERFERLRRECVEGAVLDMFGWESGEFSFEVGDDVPEDDFEVMLEAGINAQYLAMEGTRRTDEGVREPEVDADDPASFADLAEEMAEEGSGPSDAFEAVALTTVERVGEDREGAGFHTTEDEVEEAFEAALDAADRASAAAAEPAVTAAAEPAESAGPAVPATPAPATAAEPARPARSAADDPTRRPPVVVLADDLPVLEWVKRVLEGAFRRVHIFQKADLAVQRLRQYVARGDSALVLVSPGLEKKAFRKVDALVSRMKKQSPRSSVLWLGQPAEAGNADGFVPCAETADAASPAGPSPDVAEALKAAVLGALGLGDAAPTPVLSPPVVDERLAAVVARLNDPATRGEVLNVVLDFASEHFVRVALFAVRDGQALGIAGLGLDAAGGPDDEGLREVQVSVEASGWMRRVVEHGATVRAPATDEGDRLLAAHLGEAVPSEAWLSPVISGGQVVAILYGDNLPEGAPLRETPALEAALAKAGEVLEQAMEERARSAG